MMKETIVIDGSKTTMHGYGIGYHTEGQNKIRIEATQKDIYIDCRKKHLWIDTARGRYVLSRIVNDEHIGKPTELTFTKEGRCIIRTMDADQKEKVYFAYDATAPRKRAPGKRGRPRRDRALVKQVMAVVKIEKAKGVRNHIVRAAEALRMDRKFVKDVTEAERKKNSNLNTAIQSRK